MPTVSTAWVKPPYQTTGLDYLGVQAIGISIYGRLTPGVTNVTNRATYYSFYPWFVWTFENTGTIKRGDFIEYFRRADCLFTLIAALHGKGQEEGLHGATLVGRDQLLPALNDLIDGKTVRLSKFTPIENTSGYRYFKSRLGGLGQYYLGTLRDLKILSGDLTKGLQFTEQRGRSLAEAFDSRVDRDHFWKAIRDDEISIDTLKALESFCPCNSKLSQKEQDIFLGLFFNQPGPFQSDSGARRVSSFNLLMDLIAHLNEDSNPELDLVPTFRSCAYGGVLPNGEEWTLPKQLEVHLKGWQIYQTHELLSVAIQSVFWAALQRLEMESGLTPSREEFGDWFVTQFVDQTLGSSAKLPFSKMVQSARETLPDKRDCTNPRHEMDIAWELLRTRFSRQDKEAQVDALKRAVDILLALAVRDQGQENPYADWLEHPDHQLSYYPINLVSFRRLVRTTWAALSMQEWLRWVVLNWGLDVHFKVALRKLRAELKDTFRIRPTDAGLRVIGAIDPVFSNPRLVQAIQILWDLDIIETDSDKHTAKLTAKGRELLEAARA